MAKFNQNFLVALCSVSSVDRVTAILRHQPVQIDEKELPTKLRYMTKGAGGKIRYLCTIGCLLFRNDKVNLVVCGHLNLLPIAYMVARIKNVPFCGIIHGIDAWKPNKSKVVNFLIARADFFVSVSEVTIQRFTAWSNFPKNRIYLLPNCFNPEQFSPGLPLKEKVECYGIQNRTVIMSLGRLVGYERYKGFDVVLECLPILINHIPDIVYIIVGEGDDRKRLEEKAKRLLVADKVIFTGYVSELSKADYYRLAQAFVMPSQGEGFGIVFLEAMACGIPVVGSILDGGREALRDGRLGTLVDPRDLDNTVSGILTALNQKVGIPPDGLDYFSYTAFEKRISNIIDDVIVTDA
jgi:glycosyltransferase involved in cell wall biosynthesis